MEGSKSVRVGLIFGFSTVVKLLSGLVVIRLISRKIGADGLGQLGQLMSVMGIVALLAGGGIFTGLIKYVAEFRGNHPVLERHLRVGSLIVTVAAIVLGLGLFSSASAISMLLLGTSSYAGVIRILALVQALIAMHNFAVSIINGYQDVMGFAGINLNGSLLSVGAVYVLTAKFGLRGAMIGIVLAPALLGVFSIPYAFYRKFLTMDRLRPLYEAVTTRKLLGYSGMLFVSACTLPVAQIIVRKMIVAQYGWSAVGYWQGVTKVSDIYLQFVTVVLANYYLPELASATSLEELKKRVAACFRVALPTTVALALMIFICKGYVIRLIFAPSFMPMRQFFLFQAIGDCLKVCSLTLGYVTVAKAMSTIYIGLEILQSCVFVGLAFVFLKVAGPVGVTYAYAVTFLVQLGVVSLLFWAYCSPTSRYYNHGT